VDADRPSKLNICMCTIWACSLVGRFEVDRGVLPRWTGKDMKGGVTVKLTCAKSRSAVTWLRPHGIRLPYDRDKQDNTLGTNVQNYRVLLPMF